MPPGAKKRKAMQKKKKQQETIKTSTNSTGFNLANLHENDESGNQDERNVDSSLSSPSSQGYEDPSAAVSSGPVDRSAQVTLRNSNVTQKLGAVERRGMDDMNNILENSSNSYSENSTQTAKNVACEGAFDKPILEISPVVDSVTEKSEQVETSPHSNLEKQKSEGTEEYASLEVEKDNVKVVTLPGSAPETSKTVESVRESENPSSAAGTSNSIENVRESEVSVLSEEKCPLLSGPPATRTSWLSCCGLFDAMTGSDR